MPLILTVSWGEEIHVGGDTTFTVVRRKGSQVSVAISSSRNLPIATETQRRKRKRKEAAALKSKEASNDSSQ